MEHGTSPLPEGLMDASADAAPIDSGDGMCRNCSLAPAESVDATPTTNSHKVSIAADEEPQDLFY